MFLILTKSGFTNGDFFILIKFPAAWVMCNLTQRSKYSCNGNFFIYFRGVPMDAWLTTTLEEVRIRQLTRCLRAQFLILWS
jgi:hypothetical protein